MTVFAQRFKTCSSKFERSTAPISPLLVRNWQQWLMAIWFCLDPFVASANRSQLTPATERQIWHG